ncbi:MAG: TetR-like C-terminal domain-containing protein [Chloroflexota bacterium]
MRICAYKKSLFSICSTHLIISLCCNHLTKLFQAYDKVFPRVNHLSKDYNFALSYLAGGMLMLIKSWIDDDTKRSPQEMAELTQKLILNGVFPILFDHSELK